MAVMPVYVEGYTINAQDTQQHSPVNFASLDKLREAMGDIFTELLSTYIEQSRAYLEEMDTAFAARSIQDLERIFHSIGSSSLNMGAETLSAFARELEHKTKEGSKEIVTDEINHLKNEYFAVEKILQDLLFEDDQ